MEKNLIGRVFLLILVVGSIVACFMLFRPFLPEILIAAVLTTIFYKPFIWIAKKLGGRRKISALIVCLFVVLIVIIPLADFIVLAGKEAVVVYAEATEFFNKTDWSLVLQKNPLAHIKGFEISPDTIKNFAIDAINKSTSWFVSGATGFIVGTTSFILSLILIILTMFFFFLDGKQMLEKLMHWSPLPNRYDREIFKKFQSISYSFFVATFAVALVQGFACWLGIFMINTFFGLHFPAFFAAVGTAFLTLIPFGGGWLIWLPLSIYLFATGNYLAGALLFIWGAGVISTSDNIVRTIVMKRGAQVHPIFVLFSVLGGISLFGFWGVVLGPLVVAIAITIFHIYEIEYEHVLEK